MGRDARGAEPVWEAVLSAVRAQNNDDGDDDNDDNDDDEHYERYSDFEDHSTLNPNSTDDSMSFLPFIFKIFIF